MSTALDRRTFLKIGVAAGGGLLLGFRLDGLRGGDLAVAGPERLVPNAYLEIGIDGRVTVLVPKAEMGQGVLTALPALLAEELDVDWAQVSAVQAPAASPYKWSFGQQMTGGSDAVRKGWTIMRQAGASARALLIQAAAQTWGVSAGECATDAGTVTHGPTGRKLAYGDLVAKAATLRSPDNAPLKDPATFRIVGKSLPRLDTPPKTRGQATFGIDAHVPGMLVAVVARCPVHGAKVRSFDAKAAKAMPGVRHVLQISNGVAVVADGYWQARQAMSAVEVGWDLGRHAKLSSRAIEERYSALVDRPEKTLKSAGDVDRALSAGSKRISGDFWVPYLAHATMEPLNCTADVRPDGCDIWVGTQAQTQAQDAAKRITGLSEDKVKVHTLLLGGGFGRKAESDFVAEAVEISKAVGKPIKVVWSREDDMGCDFYRPATFHRMEASIGADGWPSGWKHRVVTSSVLDRVFPMAKFILGKDPVVTDGFDDQPYAFPHMKMEIKYEETGIPVGFWRSVGYSQNTFAVESFLDELAAAGGKDPLEVRRRLLADNPRLLGVVELAAEKAGWGQPLPEGRYRGIAACEPFGSFIAQVAEIAIADGEIKVHRVVCAVDCGFVVNPGIVEAQMESGIVYGLSAALNGEITLEGGKIQQSNFHDYPVMRMSDMPAVEVHLVPSHEAPGGVGEIGVPCVAPAVANAVLAATGKPVRRLPIRLA